MEENDLVGKWRANWTGRWADSEIWEPHLESGSCSGHRVKGADFLGGMLLRSW